jgi:PDZ domain
MDQHGDDRGAGSGADQAAGGSDSLHSPGRRVPRGGRIVRWLAGVVAGAGLLAGAGLTHFAAHSGRLAATDQSLMRMQRMGPPPYLQGAYEQLNSDTVAIRDASTGRVTATGIYTEAISDPARLPTFTSFLPESVKHLLESADANTTYAAIFVAPLQDITARRLLVDTSSLQLPGVVVRTDKALGLAAITATVSQAQLSGLDVPPLFFSSPGAGTSALGLLIMRRNPALHHRSGGFMLTSGGLSGGQAWCGTPVSGADSGAPLGLISPSGELFLAGLAVPSIPGRCSILGSWNIDQFLAVLTVPGADQGPKVTYLGVTVESTATARAGAGYRGRQQGVYITSVAAGSPAIAAGLRPGDVIIGIGATQVNSPATLRAAIQKLRPGTAHTVTFLRDGAPRTVRVIFAAIPLSDEAG